ncbi:uncharacterized protein LOC126904271 isoform X2 [Daktulosphaira vitifoliae]|uniref:uncharacterized protein LOC126904271 isoform X2 n=1 Tax=Daktulosphaira vitifoliae TaxID=58002 RepID=UPI0021AA0136|nr:uncharacterized protein LOC126904271 isoform X2 [Daktulosphaira vitifoliae]
MIGGYGWAPVEQANSLTWIPCNAGDPLPRGAVHVGVDKDGGHLYAGRAFHEGDLLPAKINPNHEGAYVCWGGTEHVMSHFEVLCHASVAWQSTNGNNIPPNAIVIGSTVEGEKLYMGRALYDGTLTPGKIQPSHGTLYIPYNGEEVAVGEYEILVYRPAVTVN